MKLSRRTLVKAAVAGTVLSAGCGDDDVTGTTEPGDDPEIEGTETQSEDDTPGAGGNDTETETEEEMETATDGEGESPTETGAGAATVQVGEHEELGEILVGPAEMTLYMFEQDTQGAGESACTDGCAESWPPLTVEEGEPAAGEGVTAELSTFEREDGSMQVAANGWPLYWFSSDEEPGDAMGQGANEVWWVLGPDGEPIQEGASTGTGTGTGTSTPTETP